MNGFLSKVARLAVSKAAAFSYAVAVGVAGNLIFHFVQPQVPVPAILAPATTETALPTAKPHPSEPAATAAIAPKHVVAPAPEPPPSPASASIAAPAPPPPKPALAAQAPEPRGPNLPQTGAMPAPVWKPLMLPNAAPPSEAALKAAPAVPSDLPDPGPPATAALPPLGPSIEVSTPPTPPEHVAAPIQAGAPASSAHPATDAPPPARSLELSDMWHPYRAVKKGLGWAGDRVSVITGDGADEHAAKRHPEPVAVMANKPSAPADPIPLLPAKPELADAPAAPSKPAPGPGSGGLY